MTLKNAITSSVNIILDLCSALLLACYALIIGPLGFLRGTLVIERFFWYLGVFIPLRLLSRAVRVAIDWRLGHFEVAIAQAEGLITAVEYYCHARPQAETRRKVLLDLYTLLVRAYLHTGRIDEAMQVILRAKKVAAATRLPGLADLDAKTAHLVRAGLAAGRLLEGGGLATMFVKSNLKKGDPTTTDSLPPRQGATAKDVPQSGKDEDNGAKIIPFPNSDSVV